MCCVEEQNHKLEAESAGWTPLAEPGVRTAAALERKVAPTAAVQQVTPGPGSDLLAMACGVLRRATQGPAGHRRES